MSINQHVMLSSPLLLFVFISGFVVFCIFGYGIYLHTMEIHEEFEVKRKSKILYRTNEEFTGK